MSGDKFFICIKANDCEFCVALNVGVTLYSIEYVELSNCVYFCWDKLWLVKNINGLSNVKVVSFNTFFIFEVYIGVVFNEKLGTGNGLIGLVTVNVPSFISELNFPPVNNMFESSFLLIYCTVPISYVVVCKLPEKLLSSCTAICSSNVITGSDVNITSLSLTAVGETGIVSDHIVLILFWNCVGTILPFNSVNSVPNVTIQSPSGVSGYI